MIDFHTHILPELDDGSGSVAESVSMLEAMASQGVTTVIATPHFDMARGNIQKFLKLRAIAANRLKRRAPDCPHIFLGAEVMERGVPLAAIKEIESLCIEGTRLMLIETELKEWSKSFYRDMVRLISERGIVPVLAHIERVYFIGKNREMIHSLHQEGALLQMNAGLFLRRLTRRRALALFRNEAVDFLGSDCHNMGKRPPNAGMARSIIAKHLGQDVITDFEKQEKELFPKEEQEAELK